MKHLNTFILLFGFSLFSYAQELVITLTNSTTESFAVSQIASLSYGPGTLILSELNGTTTTWHTVNIDNFSFGSLSTPNHELTTHELIIYPNPATNLVNIQFKADPLTLVKIDIFDATGKHIKQVFNGVQEDNKLYQWNSNVEKGVYYCKIETDKKIISKPIIIN
jgi:hypothetical protein